jgi:hypothetical protein
MVSFKKRDCLFSAVINPDFGDGRVVKKRPTFFSYGEDVN